METNFLIFKCLLTGVIILLNYNVVNCSANEKIPTTAVSKPPTTMKPLITDELAGEHFLNLFNNEVNVRCAKRLLNDWSYASNMTNDTRAAATESLLEYNQFMKNMSRMFAQYDWKSFKNESTRRQFMIASIQGGSALSEEKLRKLTNLKQTMEGIYSSAKICDYKMKTKCNLSLEPDIVQIMRKSREPNELKSMWLQFRDATGKKMRVNYTGLATLINETATANKFSDASYYETRSYESPTLKEDLQKIWEQLAPFYQQLHAYVRRKLRDYYIQKSNYTISKTGPIPAHLLGNMWSQSWSNIYDIVVPFPLKEPIDVSSVMFEKNLTPYNMTRMAEEFFVSIGFPPLPPEFWSGSILTKPEDREMICHASAWDMCDGKNFWIKQCTRVNMEDFITLHHEMGHIQYQIQYKTLPKLFREGANPGFHEAIGDMIALSVGTPQHLYSVGLLKVVENDADADINYLLSMALDKIAFLPFAFLVDKWRWDVFQNIIKPEDYNCAWWKLRYFVSSIVQFQFHQALCEAAKQYNSAHPAEKPLHKCDIHGSKQAGQKLLNMLRMGASRPWPEAMKALTGQSMMTAEPMLAYFRPLMNWLEKENKLHNVTVGWKEEKPSSMKGKSASPLLVVPQWTWVQLTMTYLLFAIIR